MFEQDYETANFAQIKVIGVGGAGCNAINRMVQYGLRGVEFIAVNTDRQALYLSKSETKIQIGEKAHARPGRRRGPGDRPQGGRREPRDALGGHQGRGHGVHHRRAWAAARAPARPPSWPNGAKELGVLTVGVVTKPFTFEGKVRMRNAEIGIAGAQAHRGYAHHHPERQADRPGWPGQPAGRAARGGRRAAPGQSRASPT